jgi:energy-coupling factor transporter ATP-binding protein EcfA2
MIKLETIHIEEMRGIKKLDLDFQKKTFAIYGPNGSGKSGVIDAIEFGLTGQIGRLTGRGTKGLSVGQHGPHVDKIKFPDAPFVELRVFLGDLNRSVTIRRMISSPKKLTVVPEDAAVRAALEKVAEHPEITLSRREILRFILVEPTKRSEEIQALLKLEEIGDARRALNTAQNRLVMAHNEADALVKSRKSALQLHLQIPALKHALLLETVNKRRKVLDLPGIDELKKETKLDEGLVAGAAAAELNKESALRDIKALVDAEQNSGEFGKKEIQTILADLAKIEDDPTLLAALQQRDFVEKGLSLVDRAECPLCDAPWPDTEHLKEHLKEKLAKSEQARKIQDALLKNGSQLSAKIVQCVGLLPPVAKIADVLGEKDFSVVISGWKNRLEALKPELTSVDKIRKLKGQLEGDWVAKPENFPAMLAGLDEKLKAKPDQTATIDAQTFLSTAQVRLSDYRDALRENETAVSAKAVAKIAYDTYCAVLEEELNALYKEVQNDFGAFYRALNGSDEEKFSAKLTPTAGSVSLDVNFYGRGMFPPAAYHSEGHQDGMGVCLYLALMKRLFGGKFDLSLLDDVVMSVDSAHRYEFCKLLKTHFPKTQFIITTHDRLWAQQMRSAGLVTGKTSIEFYNWNIETGPLVQSDEGVWEEIEAALAKGKVDSAGAALRRHLEYAASTLADQLGARPQYRADGTYELDDMMTSVLTRIKKLWGIAAEAAKSWEKESDERIANEQKRFVTTCDGAARVEQWAINKLVHYNEWANFGKSDFEPVVKAFRELMDCFRCKDCGSWIYVLPRVNPQSLRCTCANINFNLADKEE